MKKKTRVAIFGFAGCFVLIIGIWLYFCQKSHVNSEIKDCFHNAVSEDITIRWKKLGWPIHTNMSTKDIGDSIVIENREGVKTVPAFENTMSEDEKFRCILQTILRYENPVNTNALDSIYQTRLKDRNIFISTAVCYTDKVLDKVYKSSNDTSFYKKAYLLPSVVTGIEKEIVLQAFADVTFFSVVRNSTALFFVWCFICITFLFSTVSFLYKNPKQIVAINGEGLLMKKETEVQIMDDLILDTELRVLKYGKLTKRLTDQSVLLLKLFLSHHDHFLSNDDIRNHLWGTIEFSDSRRNQSIKRLRDALGEIPVLHIENIRGMGFRLIIDDEK